MVGKSELVEYEHPDWGQLWVLFRWTHVGGGYYRWVPIVAEFDLFCPQEEQERIVTEMRDLQRSTERRSAPGLENRPSDPPWNATEGPEPPDSSLDSLL